MCPPSILDRHSTTIQTRIHFGAPLFNRHAFRIHSFTILYIYMCCGRSKQDTHYTTIYRKHDDRRRYELYIVGTNKKKRPRLMVYSKELERARSIWYSAEH